MSGGGGMKIEKQSIYYDKLSIENKLEHDKMQRSSMHQRAIILVGLFILIIFSIANMISTTFYDSISSGKKIFLSVGNPLKHIIWILLGIVVLVTAFKIPYNYYQRKRVRSFLFFGSITVLLGVLIGAKIVPGLVPEINGSIGWIKIAGFTIQPSEFFKVTYVIILAHFLEVSYRKRSETKGTIGNLLPVCAIFCALVFLQGDLGTTIHYIVITACMLLVSPISKKLISWVLYLFPMLVLSFFSIFYFKDIGGGYRMRRITSYIDILLKGKERDMGVGYQVIQSLIAMGNGGIMGRGYGNGIQKYNYLPEIHTDFISSSLAEEWGFAMMVLILLIFLLILRISINTAIMTKHYFAKYLIIGLGSLIFTQMLMNLYVATGLMPVTGLPLPIFSYGGSSTLTIFLSLGIILNVNKKSVKDKYS